MQIDRCALRGFLLGIVTGWILICAVLAILLWMGTLPESIALPPHVTPY